MEDTQFLLRLYFENTFKIRVLVILCVIMSDIQFTDQTSYKSSKFLDIFWKPSEYITL